MEVMPVNPSMASEITAQVAAAEIPGNGSEQELTSRVSWISIPAPLATMPGAGASSTTIRASLGLDWVGADRKAATGVSAGRFVQWTSSDHGAATSETTYQDRKATPGNLILVFSHWDNQALTAAVTDNLRNAYASIAGPVNAGPTARFEVWYAKNIRGGAPLAITVTYSGKTTSFSLVDAIEYSGLDKSAPLDVFASTAGTGTYQDSGPSPTTRKRNETIVGLFGYSTYALPYTAGAGFTMRGYDASSMLEDQAVTNIGSYHATAASNRSDFWAAFVIGFKNATQP
jgi:hypothetical protein